MTYRSSSPTDPGYTSLFCERVVRALKAQIPYTPSYFILLLSWSVVFREDCVGGWGVVHATSAMLGCALAALLALSGTGVDHEELRSAPFRVWRVSTIFATVISIASVMQLHDGSRPDPVRVWMNCRPLPAHDHEKAR